MTPFLLKGAKFIPSRTLPIEGCTYDPQRQLWIDSKTGNPFVLSDIANTTSVFGETTITETREAIDQCELTTLAPYLRSNSSSNEYEGSTNQSDFHFALRFLIDAPYTHF